MSFYIKEFERLSPFSEQGRVKQCRNPRTFTYLDQAETEPIISHYLGCLCFLSISDAGNILAVVSEIMAISLSDRI